MYIVLSGKDIVQFPDDHGAPFFVECFNLIPALIDELENAERRCLELGEVEIDHAVVVIAKLERERDEAVELLRRTEELLRLETEKRTLLEKSNKRLLGLALGVARNKARGSGVD